MTLPTRFTRRRFVARYGALTSLAALFVSGCGPPLTAPPPLDLTALTPTERATATHQEPSQTPVPTVSATPDTSADPPTPSNAESLATPRAPTLPRPTVTTQGRLNYLRTDKARILDAGGNEVLLTGLNWFGMETGTLAPHGLWTRSYQSMLDQIVRAGYNCLRLPYSNDLFDPKRIPNGIDFNKNPALKGMSGLHIMDTIIVEAGKRGLKIILDQHRPNVNAQSALWYTDHLSQATWLAQWQALAERYRGNDAVIGADLHNEPSGACTWGTGDPKTDWALAAELCGNTILEVNPNWLIVVEGIEKILDKSGNVLDWTWKGGELINARKYPIELKVPSRLVYSAHDYGPSVFDQHWFHDPTFPDNLPGFWDMHWGYLQQQGVAPVLVGEFGGPSVGRNTEGIWQRTLVAYLKKNRLHYTYWCLNPDSGDTGGLLENDWRTIHPAKQALLKTDQGGLLENVAPHVVNDVPIPVNKS